jgi:hypothetical protein
MLLKFALNNKLENVFGATHGVVSGATHGVVSGATHGI